MRAGGVPAAIAADLKQASRLEYWTLAVMSSVVLVMFFASSGSAAFRTALIEDVLSLVPALVFLIAVHFERKAPDARFPYGYHRVNSLAFLISAAALTAVGGFLLFESLKTLLLGERPELDDVRIFGREIWSGWVMIAALIYSIIPPFILGRLKQPVAKRLYDKVLHTDALMQKADWMTGLAGILGITGIWFGLWWADAAAAAFISVEVLRDGLRNLRSAAAELNDGVPRALESNAIAPDAEAVRTFLQARHPDAEVKLRETGRYIRATVSGAEPAASPPDAASIPGLADAWRLEEVAYAPRSD